MLELELTERIVTSQGSDVASRILALHRLGFTLSIDDFGTGYSSLSNLKQFKIDTLKIDKSFVNDLTEDRQSADIVIAIISMAKALEMKVVAEGVETPLQLRQLQNYQCDAYQGYLHSKPQPADDFSHYLK